MPARPHPRRPLALPLPVPLVLLLLLHVAAGAGVFELQVLEFSNYRGALASGACCGGGARPRGIAGAAVGATVSAAGGTQPQCTTPCRTRFALCLKEYQSAAAPGACSFGSAASPVLGTGSFTLPEPLYTLALPFSFRWTRSFTLILQAYDDFNYTEPESGLIEEAWWSGIVEPGAAWHALRHAGAAAALAYRVRVSCQQNYFNATCTTFCRPRDDQFGHYACADTGEKRCLPGWRGDNCDIPVCKEGCHAQHGRCDRPGDCDCRPGWRGELCAQCQPYPGCKHGYCNGSSWDCTCDTNWGGILCDQDLNYCGTHEPCQHGGTCENTAPDQYLCTCAEGFSGVDCERVDNPCAPQPCVHGACTLSPAPPGYTCACERGWAGALCDADVDDCASAPCRHGAACRDLLDAFACDCTTGWMGPTCEEDVDECAGGRGPCVNAAACVNSAGGYSCTCLAGWTGRDCETNVDDCEGQCRNGATCIDLVDDFHCACAAGWAGRRCDTDVDDCASRPCRNGGECVDLLDAYRCICPVGFTGTDCQEDRDHCAGAPCGNGAPCYTAQDDYYCHCAPGWAGKNCTQPAAVAPSAAPAPAVPAPAPTECETCSPHSEDTGKCGEVRCGSGGTCVMEGVAGRCLCGVGWGGAACDVPTPCGCGPGGTCVAAPLPQRWACACRDGWTGARCDLALDPCASQPCRNGARCLSTGAGGGWWTCECSPGWTGADCTAPIQIQPAAAAATDCVPTCPPPAECAADPALGPRCVCPTSPTYITRRCLEMVSEVSGAAAAGLAGEQGEWGDGDGDGEWGGACDTRNGTWWWGCNVCRCGGAAGVPVCSRLWCGLPDCLALRAQPCRSDEVCVPAAPSLCVRGPCAPLGECRRVAGRRVEPAALPAPPACWPGAPRNANMPPPPGCARAALQLARERLARGAHVERACLALRRALAAALAARAPPAPPQPPLVLLCDLAADDDDTLDLALWAGDDDGIEGQSGTAVAAGAVRLLAELVSRRRLAAHALLGAALRLHADPPTRPVPPPSPAVPSQPAATGASAVAVALAATVPLALLATAAGVVLLVRRRRAIAAARSRRHDEEKSNNLQNEENLRRYANPLREPQSPRAALYKAPDADARNNTPAHTDKDLNKRALPPAPAAHPSHAAPGPPAPVHHHPPPERLTVLV